MSTKKIEEEKKQQVSATRNLNAWMRVDKAAEILGVVPDSILNNVYDKKYPELYVRQSVFSKTWFVWLPAVIRIHSRRMATRKLKQHETHTRRMENKNGR